MRRSPIDSTLAIAFVALVCGGANAHPSSGIVVDQKGRVFFQDIVGGVIWMIDEHGKLTKYSKRESMKR